ncbi:NAD(P)H-binding protein [Thermoplasma acidophilum]|uniref:NAD(P)H-binding protein n=1 Tax=Thermoplasma acidophilum TaxID=2303 RepID=UPI00373AF582
MKLLPLLLAGGYFVAGMTRSPEKVRILENVGAKPILCDVYDPEDLEASIVSFDPDIIISLLTDLPDHARYVRDYSERNNRMRTEGVRNLLSAARAADSPKLIVESVAWTLERESAEAVDIMEKMVWEYGGIVIRYGRLYGPGTYYQNDLPAKPRIHVDRAAILTAESILSEEKIIVIADE